jgi:hypothetical protein
MADSVRYAIEAGQLLSAKKDSLEHGEWLPWLEANADTLRFNNRKTASRLMKLAKQYGSLNGAPAPHLNDAEILQISRQIWGHDKTRKAPAPKPKVEVIPPPAPKMVTDLSFLSVDDRQRVEAIIHRVEQQFNDQIKALAKENADLTTRIQEYKQCMKDLLNECDSLSSPVSSSPVSPVQESSSPNPPVSGIFPVSSVSTPSPILPAQESTSPASAISLVHEPSSSPSSIQGEEGIVSSISSSIPSGTKKKSRLQELADNWRSIPDPYREKIRAEISNLRNGP